MCVRALCRLWYWLLKLAVMSLVFAIVRIHGSEHVYSLPLPADEGISAPSSEAQSGLPKAELTPAWGSGKAADTQLNTADTADRDVHDAAVHTTHAQPPAHGGLDIIAHAIAHETTLDPPAPTVPPWLQKEKQSPQAMLAERSLEQDTAYSDDGGAVSHVNAEAGCIGAGVQAVTARSVLEDKQLFLSWFVKKLDLLTMLRLASGKRLREFVTI